MFLKRPPEDAQGPVDARNPQVEPWPSSSNPGFFWEFDQITATEYKPFILVYTVHVLYGQDY